MRLTIAAALLAAAFAAHAQQLYRWTDEKGRVHVTDTPPPAGAKNVQKRGGAASAEPAGARTGAEPYALQVARRDYPVTLYSTPGCQACDEARRLLNSRGVPFKEVSVSDEKSIEDLKRTVGSNSVPALIVGATVQKGFEEGAYQRVLDAAGYPATGILPPRNQAEPKAVEPKAEVKPAAPEAEAPPGPYSPRFSTETRKK